MLRAASKSDVLPMNSDELHNKQRGKPFAPLWDQFDTPFWRIGPIISSVLLLGFIVLFWPEQQPCLNRWTPLESGDSESTSSLHRVSAQGQALQRAIPNQPQTVAVDDEVTREFVDAVLHRANKQVQIHTRWDDVTADTQLAVAFLEQYVPMGANCTILEVGTGQNHVALRLGSRASAVYSITISLEELARANSLKIPNYRVLLHNKHNPIPDAFIPDGSLDYILDVNIGSFSRIWQWNAFLLLRKLKPGGKLILQEIGMGYTMPQVGSASVTPEMIRAHEEVLGYRVEEFMELAGQHYGAFVLTKVGSLQDLKPMFLV